jgi:hypothetical protein
MKWNKMRACVNAVKYIRALAQKKFALAFTANMNNEFKDESNESLLQLLGFLFCFHTTERKTRRTKTY